MFQSCQSRREWARALDPVSFLARLRGQGCLCFAPGTPGGPFPRCCPLLCLGKPFLHSDPPFQFTMKCCSLGLYLCFPHFKGPPLPVKGSHYLGPWPCSFSGFGDPPSGHSLNVDESLLPH